MLVTTKAHEGDLIELTEDVPKYDLKRGQRGFVIEAFDEPNEAYDIEFEDGKGEFIGFAYSVRPSQIVNLDALAKESFERGVVLINEGKPPEAEREFQRAIDLRPALIVNLHNLIVNTFEGTNQWEDFIVALRLILRLNPDFEIDAYNMSFIARNNLATAYQNYAVQKANEGDIQAALVYFGQAIGVASRAETISLIRKNLANAHTSVGMQSAQRMDYEGSVARMNLACGIDPNEITQHNLGIAYAQLAEHYLDQRDYENAIPVFEHALDIGLMFPEFLNDYGMALAMAGHQDEAILAFQRAMTLSPDNQVIQHNLRLVEAGANVGFSILEMKVEFYRPAMEQEDYLKAA